MLLVLALLAALVTGTVTSLLLGTPVGVAVALLLLVAGVIGHARRHRDDVLRRAIGATLLVTLLGAGTAGTLQVFEVVDAVTTVDGSVDPADTATLGSAEDKLAGLGDAAAFRVELTEPELQAVIQDGLAEGGGGPIRRVDLDLRGPGTATTAPTPAGPAGDLAFVATFKAGDVQATGTATVGVVDGGLDVLLGPLRFGSVQVPGVAAGAVESLLGAVTDLNAALAAQRASVQGVELRDDALIVTGTRAATDVVTEGDLLAAIRAQASEAASAVQAPPERIGRGVEASADAPGDPIVLAVGDSLAAAVGVEDPRDGYVSRFHGFVERQDGVDYGLVNLGAAGETSGSLLRDGQLAEAEQRLAARRAAYVLLDVGANDLLGHLDSPDCGADLTAPACQQRVAQALGAYRTNLGRILDRLVAAAGGSRVMLLQAYNPFSLGLGDSAQVRESSAVLMRLNAIAAEEAAARGVTVADGFTPMLGTTAATTHMLDPEPDIHPNAAGYDVLAAALVDAL